MASPADIPVNSEDPPSMPYLPQQLLRSSTPVSSHYHGSERSNFFKKLPFEIRRQILCDTFGDQTLHIELDYDHPMIPRKMPTTRHAARNSGWTSGSSSFAFRPKYHLETDRNKSRKWRWWSCVCHRQLKPISFFKGQVRRENEPWFDQCKYGYNNWCEKESWKIPNQCYIGVMGWLLSCRQA